MDWGAAAIWLGLAVRGNHDHAAAVRGIEPGAPRDEG